MESQEGFSAQGRDAAYDELFNRMDPGYVLSDQDRCVVDARQPDSRGQPSTFPRAYGRLPSEPPILSLTPPRHPPSSRRECLHSLLEEDERFRVSREIFRRSIKLWYPPLRGKTAMVMVDMQNDFVNGSLKVPDGAQAILSSNDLRARFK